MVHCFEIGIWCALCALLGFMAGAASATAASSNVPVQLSVLSHTSIDPTSCPSMTAGVTAFGSVAPSIPSVIGPCRIGFGSNNDTSTLLMTQQDGFGAAMFQLPDGPLDATFNAGGTPGYNKFRPAGVTQGYLDAVAVDGGRIIAAGNAVIGSDRRPIVLAFTPGGVLDTMFSNGDVDGINGAYWVNITTGIDRAWGVTVAPDGKIYVAGEYTDAIYNQDAFLFRLTASGLIDNGFAGGLLRSQTVSNDKFSAVEAQPDGKVVVAGKVGSDMFISRYDSSGTLDNSFNGTGTRTFDLGTDEYLDDITILDDGSIIGSGMLDTGAFTRPVLVKVSSTGSVVWTASQVINSSNSVGFTHVVQSNGRIIVVGRVNPGDQFAVAFTSTGLLDTTWAADQPQPGVRIVSVGGNEYAFDSVVTPDDRVFVTGWADIGGNRFSSFRLLANGGIDTSYGSSGIYYHTSFNGTAGGAVMGHDGQLVLAGGSGSDFAVERHGTTTVNDYDDSSLPTDNDFAADTGTFGACLKSTTGVNVSALWTMTGSCIADDADPWYRIPATMTVAARVARTTAVGAIGTADLYFGTRPAPSQKKGLYLAPVQFTVVAPAL